jgi:hypothetical protein
MFKKLIVKICKSIIKSCEPKPHTEWRELSAVEWREIKPVSKKADWLDPKNVAKLRSLDGISANLTKK